VLMNPGNVGASTGLRKTAIEEGAALVLLAVVAVGGAIELLVPDVFWVGMAIWIVGFSIVPVVREKNLARITDWRLLAMMSIPFLLAIVGKAQASNLLAIDDPLSWLAESVALTAICLATLARLDVRGEMNMSAGFRGLFSYLLLLSVVVVHGWVSWYSDLSLGTSLVPSNDAYMVFFIACTFLGLVMILAVNVIAGRTEFRTSAAGGGRA